MKTGILLEDEGMKFCICHECNAYRKRKNPLPPLSLANGNYCGQVPECLKDLSLAEEMLIPESRLITSIISLYATAAKGASQRAIKGNACAVVHSTPDVTQILPRSLESLSEHIQICFTGQNKPLKKELKNILRVRRKKVADGLSISGEENK